MSGIKFKKLSIEEIEKQNLDVLIPPIKQNKFFRFVVSLISEIALKKIGFKFNKKDSDLQYLNEPCLILMNHIFETDFNIAFKILKHTDFNISACRESFVGRKKLLQNLGCLSTVRYRDDIHFVKGAVDVFRKFNSSLLIYPEAEYCPDGLGQPIAPSFGKFVKALSVPVLLIRTYGNYNYRPEFTTRKNRSKLSATIKCILTKDDVKNKTDKEIFNIINCIFESNNYYKERDDLNLRLTNKNRADDIHKLLFKCPHCLKEHSIVSKGSKFKCNNCSEEYILNDDYSITNLKGNNKFNDIESWIIWQKEEIRKELINKTLNIKIKCKLNIFRNTNAIYDVSKIACLSYSNDLLSLDYDDKHLERDLTYSWGICAMPRCVQVGSAIVTEFGDNNYFLIPIVDDGSVYKLRVAVTEAFKLKKVG